MTAFRRRILNILITVHVVARLLLAFMPQPDSRLLAALERYEGKPLPAVVCAPMYPNTGDVMFYPLLYAVIPSIMVLPDAPCDMHLTR